MTRFRPCIDIYSGKVTQIVGGTLKDNNNNNNNSSSNSNSSSNKDASTSASANTTASTNNSTSPGSQNATQPRHTTNHTSRLPSTHFARLYRENGLTGGHVIMLDAIEGSRTAAREACAAWPGEMQVGGGINAQNAAEWIAAGAGKVIVTSYLFPDANFSIERLRDVVEALDCDHSRLVIDLSCRRQRPQERRRMEREREQEQAEEKKQGQQLDDSTKSTGNDNDNSTTDESEPVWIVAMNKWQKPTNMVLGKDVFDRLSLYCSEFLVHAADVEGKQQGIDEELVKRLADWCPLPITYAGGARSLEDLERVKRLSGGKVDLTIGSALDVFGGSGVAFEDCVRWNWNQEKQQ